MEADALVAMLEAAELLADDLGLRIAMPNASSRFNQPTDTSAEPIYLRASVIDVSPRQLVVTGGGAIHQWILQIDVVAREGIGRIRPAQVTDAIRDRFPHGEQLFTRNTVLTAMGPADIAQPLDADNGWVSIPASITFRTLA